MLSRSGGSAPRRSSSASAQWLGTDTQQALRERAEAERQRALDAERNQLRRDAEQKIGQVRAENALLRSKLGSNAPTELELRMELRSAVTAELMRERSEAKQAVEEQLKKITDERDAMISRPRRRRC